MLARCFEKPDQLADGHDLSCRPGVVLYDPKSMIVIA
jgi:hypothetical protein